MSCKQDYTHIIIYVICISLLQAFEKDIRKYLQSNSQRQILTQVDEVCTKVRVHGIWLEEISQFLLSKGL